MKILVCGGRGFNDWLSVHKILHPYLNGSKVVNDGDHTSYTLEIISGMAKGADQIAAKYAKQYGLKLHKYHADWGKYGKKAGPIRNQQMLDEGKPDLVIAFPGKAGTRDIIMRSKRNKIKVLEVTV